MYFILDRIFLNNINHLYNRTILVYVVLSPAKDINWNLEECLSLAYSAKIRVKRVIFNSCRKICPKHFIGSGKLLKIKDIIKNQSISLVLFSNTLSATQERNLSNFLKCTIIDRNQLILSIFAQRARTYSGKLQVKLAQLRYLKSRLVHEWSHLERQTGGIGIRGGPGEMQLEYDRRLLSKNILQISSDLKKIENQRKQNRLRRLKKGIPVVSLVGYTNAGKSTLFNTMTLSNVYTSKELFATLDPTFRRITDKEKFDVILIDTVGFIQNLPRDLITAFKSTLEETIQSVLLLHVVDVSDERYMQHINTVNYILHDINLYNIPILLVMNKIDKINKEIIPHIDRNSEGIPIKVWISAQNQLGMMLIKQAIKELLPNRMVRYELKIPLHDSSLCQELYKLQAVEEYQLENKNIIKLKIYLSCIDWYRLLKYHRLLYSYIV